MTRRARLDAPSVAHHVMVRALDGARIFRDADDHQDFVDRLVRLLPDCDARCLAWAIMPNHVHLVLQTDRGELSRVMRRLNTGSAARFNRLHRRRGYVFQSCFRSRIATGDDDLVGLIRYVHRNPIEGGLVGSLEALARFPWSGHGALVGARPPHAFEAVHEARSLFGEDPVRACAELLAWMQRALPDPAAGRGDAARVEAKPIEPPARALEPPGRVGLDALLVAACERYRLTPGEIGSGSKQRRIARARATVAWVAAVELRIAGRDIAGALGVTPQAVSASLLRGRRAAREDGFSAASVAASQGANLNILKI